MQICKIYINYLLNFYKKRSKTLDKKKREMHGTGQITRSRPDHREPQLVRSGRRYFVISPGSIPLNRNL